MNATKFNGAIIKIAGAVSITTLIQGLISPLNQLAVVILTLLLVMALLRTPLSMLQFVILYLTAIWWLIAYLLTPGSPWQLNDLFYLPMWVLFLLWFATNTSDIKAQLSQNSAYFAAIIVIWNVLVFVSAFFASSYVHISDWGTGTFFASFADGPGRLASAAVIIVALVMFFSFKTGNRKYEFGLIMPLFASFMTGSRTYFAVILIIVACYAYTRFTVKRRFYLCMLLLVGIGLVLLPHTGIGAKLVATEYTEYSYRDFLGTLTNSRTVWWPVLIQEFFALPFGQQFLGNGFNFVYDINFGTVGRRIWAHNDLLNIVLNFGYVGLFLFIGTFVMMVNAAWRAGGKRATDIPRIITLLFFGALAITSFFNQVYTDFALTIAFPILMMAIGDYYIRREVNSLELV